MPSLGARLVLTSAFMFVVLSFCSFRPAIPFVLSRTETRVKERLREMEKEDGERRRSETKKFRKFCEKMKSLKFRKFCEVMSLKI